MPELPDVEVFRQYAKQHSLGRTVAAVHAPSPELLEGASPQALGRALKGRKLVGAMRHGKFMAVQTDHGGSLVLHFGMTGFLKHFHGPAEEPGHVRLRLDFEGGGALAYDCSRKLGSVLWERDFGAFVRRKGLGPDALEIDAHRFVELMRGRKGSVKTALMRQEVLAGVGNVYSDEILFQQRMHPRTQLPELQDSSLRELHDTMHTVLETAIERGASPEKLPQSWLLKARSQDAGCPGCGGEIVKENVGGRSAHYCPACQKQ